MQLTHVLSMASAVAISGVALLGTAAQAQYSSAVLADNPIIYYRFGEASGTTAVNIGSTGAAMNGTYANNPALSQPGAIPGDPNRAIRLNPANNIPYGSHVSLTQATVNNMTQGTIETWINLNSLVPQTILAKQDPNVNTMALLTVGLPFGPPVAPGQVFFHAKNDVNVLSTTLLNVGQWYHIAVTFTNASSTIYINGVASGTQAGNFSIPNDLNPTAGTGIGSWLNDGNGNSLNGFIDEFAIYNTALSPTQIQAHFEASGIGAAAPEASPLALMGTTLVSLFAFRARRKG